MNRKQKATLTDDIPDLCSALTRLLTEEPKSNKNSPEPHVDDGFESEVEDAPKPHRPKAKTYRSRTRLLVGEANYSFARALTNKHPEISSSVVATTYESSAHLATLYDEYSENKEVLEDCGAHVKDNVDAQRLHIDFAGRHFERIHFNFPHDGSDYNMQTLPPIIRNFFASAAQIQNEGDRIHIALPKLDLVRHGKPASFNEFYKAGVYQIHHAARQAGYRLVDKRSFNTDRWPGYQHVETKVDRAANAAANGREYVFEKCNLTAEEILTLDLASNNPPAFVTIKFWNWKKTGQTVHKQRYALQEIDTSSESSDYVTTDSEGEALERTDSPSLVA